MELKLSFKDKGEFDKVLIPLLHEEFVIPTRSTYTAILKSGKRITVVNVGHVPIPAVKDEEGNIIKEASQNEDWAVDILTLVEIKELNKYKVTEPPDKWYHKFKE